MDVAGPDRAVAEPTKEEYKALRDEILNLFNRIFVLLSIVIGAAATIFARLWISSRPLGDERFFALWSVVAILLVAVVATLKFYDHVARVGTYLEVFHEHKEAGWHEVNRRILKFADSEPGRQAIEALLEAGSDPRWRVRRWVRLVARWNERYYVALAYVMLSLLTGLGLWAERDRYLTDPLRCGLLLSLWLLSILLPLFIPVDQHRYWAILWRARLGTAIAKNTEQDSHSAIPEPQTERVELRWGSFHAVWHRSTNSLRRSSAEPLENNQMERTGPGHVERRR